MFDLLDIQHLHMDHQYNIRLQVCSMYHPSSYPLDNNQVLRNLLDLVVGSLTLKNQ
jgi:hypothetical protein